MSKPRRDQPAPASAVSLEDALNDTAAAAIKDSSRRTYDKQTRVYERFCDANNMDPWPAQDVVITRFLHVHRNRHSPPTSELYVSAIRRHHLDAGLPPPDATLTSRWLRAWRHTSEHEPPAPIDPLLPEDLVTIAGAATNVAVSERTVLQRAALGVARAGKLVVPQLSAITRHDVEVAGDVVTVRLDDRELVLPRREPFDSGSLVAQLIEVAPSSRLHLFGAQPQLRQSLLASARRAGLGAQWRVRPHVGSGLSESDHRWMIAMCDPTLLTDLRTVTWTLVACSQAFRNDELSRLDLETVVVTPTGFDLMVGASKGDPTGRRPVWHLNHTPDPGGGGQCAVTCGACSLGRWMSVLHHAKGLTTGPVFPTFKPSRDGRLTNGVATYHLRRLADRLDIAEGRHLGSRSPRIGTVTAMHLNGDDLAAMAAVTRHTQFRMLLHYMRIVDPWRQTWQIPA